MIETAVNLMYDGKWEESIKESFKAARTHCAALLVSLGGDPENGGLARLLGKIESSGGRKVPEDLLARSRKLDRMYLLIRKQTASRLGWSDYPDEEQCSDMIHNARSIVKYCLGGMNRSHSNNKPVDEEE